MKTPPTLYSIKTKMLRYYRGLTRWHEDMPDDVARLATYKWAHKTFHISYEDMPKLPKGGYDG